MVIQLCQMKRPEQKKACGRVGRVWVRRTFETFKGNTSSKVEAACHKCADNFEGWGTIEIVEPIAEQAVA